MWKEATLLILALALTGCQNMRRTYSVYGSSGDYKAGFSVTFEPPPTRGLAK